jgi:hypothetical protein
VRLYDGAATILPPLTEIGRQQVRTALANSTEAIRTVSGEPAARQARLAGDLARFVEQPIQALAAGFGPVQLVGATYPKVIEPPVETLPVTLFWQARTPMRQEYEILVRLVDDSRRAWGNGDARPTDWAYPTSFWRPGLDQVAAQHQVVIKPRPLEPGRYWLAVSVFDPTQGQSFPLTAGGSDSPDTFFIGPLKAPLRTPIPEIAPVSWAQPVSFGRMVELAGFEVDRQTIRAGESLRLTLLWQALTTPEVDYTVFVHLLDREGRLAAGHDAQPLAGRYPTTIWSPGEQILDRHSLPLPSTLPAGRYQLVIGLYQPATGRRLPLTFPDKPEDEQGRLILEPALSVVD